MTNEKLEQAIKTHYGALEVTIFDSDLSYLLVDAGMQGQVWRVWYSKEGVYIKGYKHYIFDEVFFLVGGMMANFPYKQRRCTQVREVLALCGKVVEAE